MFWQAVTEYEFLQRALLAGVVVGVICGVVGSIVILRGLSLMGDAISHAVLPGVALSYLLGLPIFAGAMVTGLGTALGITALERSTRLKSDTAIGVVFSAAFAGGIILITKAESAMNLNNILFGNLLAITRSDLVMTLVVAGVSLAVVILLYRHLVLTTFDPVVAPTYGSSPAAMHYLLMVMLTAVTVASLQAVGIILVVAMLITPAATALLVTKRFRPMMILAAAIGAAASVVGVILSYTFNLPSGPAIVLVLAAVFVVALIASKIPRVGLAAALVVGGCAAPTAEHEDLRVVTTFSLLGDLATQVGGEGVQVHSMVPMGTDPHEYSPLPEDIEAVAKADVVIWNGLDMETGDGWFDSLIESTDAQDRAVEAAAGVDPQWIGDGEVNPHAFLSPQAGMIYVQNITDALVDADPDQAEGYTARADDLLEEIGEMDERYEEELKNVQVPLLVTSERAFQYVATDYGLDEGYLWAIDTDEQGTPTQITELIDLVMDSQVPGILVETNVDPRPMQTVSDETGVPIVGEVYSDELGAPGTPGETYLGYLEYNLEAYQKAMG